MWANRIDDRAPLRVILSQEWQQHSNPKIKPLQHEEANIQDRDQDKPNYM
jgi:hypothetical protein